MCPGDINIYHCLIIDIWNNHRSKVFCNSAIFFWIAFSQIVSVAVFCYYNLVVIFMTGYIYFASFVSKHTAWKVSKYGVFSGLYFPIFGLNTEIYSVNLRIQSKYRKIRTRKTSVFRDFSRSDTHIYRHTSNVNIHICPHYVDAYVQVMGNF